MIQKYFNIIIFFLIMVAPLFADAVPENLDSLELRLTTCLKENTENCIIAVSRDISKIHMDNLDYLAALPYLVRIDSILGLERPNLPYFKNLYQLSSAQRQLNYFEAALENSKLLLSYDIEEYSPSLFADALRSVSAIYRSMGNFEKAYKCNMDALQVYNSLSDSIGISKTLYSIGSIFFYQKRYHQAIKSYHEAWEIAKSLNDQQQIYRCVAAIGASYERVGEIKKSIYFNKESLDLAQQMGYKTNIAYAAHNLGSNYSTIGNYEEALKYFFQSLALKKELKDEWGEIGTLGAVGNLYRAKHNPIKAIKYLEDALKKSQKIKSKTREMEIYDYLAEAHYAAEETKQGFLYLRKYVSLQDSIFNETTLKEMGKIKNKYELQKKENEIILLTKQSEIDNLQNYLLIGASFGLLLFLVLVLQQNRTQQKSNLLLEEKNKEIQLKSGEVNKAYHIQQITNSLLEEKNKEVEQKNQQINKAYKLQQEVNQLLEVKNNKIKHQNKLLESSNEDLKQFAYVASHDLKEPLRMIGAYTSLLKRRYISKLDADAQEFMHYIVDGAQRMDILLTDLLSYSRANSQDVPENIVNIQDVMSIVSNNLRTILYQKEAVLNFNFDQLPKVRGSQTHLVQLFQNLISNGLKFTGDKKPIINLNCHRNEHQFVISIQDNGIGIAHDNKEAIFEMFRRLHTREEYEGTGIGLATCKKIVERHGGKIWVESVVDEGSTFFFTIPVMEETSTKSMA